MVQQCTAGIGEWPGWSSCAQCSCYYTKSECGESFNTVSWWPRYGRNYVRQFPRYEANPALQTDRNPRNPGNLENHSSNALVLIYCNLHICGNLFAVFPSLLVCLTSPVSAVRQTVVDVISLITSRSTEKTSVLTLGRIVFESSEEIIADETFIAR